MAHVIPNFVTQSGSSVSAKDIVFEWKINGTQAARPSLGRTSHSFSPTLLGKPQVVTVIATSKDGLLRAQESVVIPVTNPSVLVYESSPLGGILDRNAVSATHPFTEAEVTLTAYPLYVLNSDAVDFGWNLNGNPIETGEGAAHTITFRKTGEGTGTYDVEVGFSGVQRFLEQSAQSFLLQF